MSNSKYTKKHERKAVLEKIFCHFEFHCQFLCSFAVKRNAVVNWWLSHNFGKVREHQKSTSRFGILNYFSPLKHQLFS